MTIQFLKYLKNLDIVAIGTISDLVPLVDENRVIVKLGLMLVKQTKNIGLRKLNKFWCTAPYRMVGSFLYSMLFFRFKNQI